MSEYDGIKCHDCGAQYGDDRWIETNVPNDVWAKISPTGDEGGILCISCISKRCIERGIDDVPVILCGTSALRQVSVDEAFDRGWKVAGRHMREQDARIAALEVEVAASRDLRADVARVVHDLSNADEPLLVLVTDAIQDLNAALAAGGNDGR